MSKIKVRNLRDDLSFGSIVEGATYETLADPEVRAELNALFEDRGMIVFKGVESSDAMHLAVSDVFGPLKDHPTKGTARVNDNAAIGVIDMHSQPRDVSDGDLRGLVEKNGKIVTRFSPVCRGSSITQCHG